MSVHIVLLGDSIFDNAAYVPGEPAVEAQLRAAMPHATVTLLAVDGDVIAGIRSQLRRIPPDATHIVVSVGGNDCLGFMDVLTERVDSVGSAMLRLADIAEAFEAGYRTMLDDVRALGLPTAVCTIYFPNFEEPGLQRMAVAAETFFNDAILRCAIAARVPVLDLRLICSDPADYANPIEPSAQGGHKITAVIAHVVRTCDFDRAASVVYAST